MDIKALLDDPDAAIVTRWGSLDQCPCGSDIERLIEQLNALAPAIKAQKNAKQLCAKAFAPAKAQGADVAELKQQMQQIADSLAALEQQRKAAEQQLLELFAAGTTTPSLPARFINAAPEIAVAGPVEIVAANAADAPYWDAYVEAHPRASFYHRYAWRTVITQAFDHESFYWVARDDAGAIRGVLPIVRLRSRLFGDFGVALPFFNYGGALADNSAIALQLLKHAAQAAHQREMRHLEIRSTQPLGNWPARTDKVSMILKLPTDGAQLEAQI
ncbi:MAG TPA: hypothetical protein VLC91_06070, partial [Spongiibacteraceae bacterium]|nr:hypothetical protein [Spongiibacteraceae bacterium]